MRISLGEDVSFRTKTTGFEQYEFIHCALPELNYDEIRTECFFLNRTLAFPLMISAMTGGWAGAVDINARLASVCHAMKLALGVGSQRQMFEGNQALESYRVVREKAPDEAVIGNIGASQLVGLTDFTPILKMAECIRADAMAVHLNPLQELLQPEGNRNFKGVLRGIEELVRHVEIPVIVKEVGCGISEQVAKSLVNVGVRYIDVAGAGGTSWAAIESFRSKDRQYALRFREWGIPTALSLNQVVRVPKVRAIASGGISDGVMMAKALAMGAELCGSAMPMLKALMQQGEEGLERLLCQWREELRMTLFLTGSPDIKALRRGVLQRISE